MKPKNILGKTFKLHTGKDVVSRKITHTSGKVFEWRFGWANISQLKMRSGKLTLDQH